MFFFIFPIDYFKAKLDLKIFNITDFIGYSEPKLNTILVMLLYIAAWEFISKESFKYSNLWDFYNTRMRMESLGPGQYNKTIVHENENGHQITLHRIF